MYFKIKTKINARVTDKLNFKFMFKVKDKIVL